MTISTMYRVGITWDGETGGPWYSQMFFDAAASTAQQAADAVGTWLASVKAYQGTQVTYSTGTVVETIDVATGQPVALNPVTAHTGTGSGGTSDTVPVGTQIVCQWRTGVFLNGREVRGRTFVPGAPYTINVLGVLDSTVQNLIAGYGATLISSTPSVFCIYSRKKRQAEVVATSSVWGKFGLVRSRRD